MEENKLAGSGQVFRFGPFQINISARELRKHGMRVRLPGQPFHILSILLARPGEIVTRDELRAKLWTSDTFVDFEHSLNSAIKKLRGVLGDSSENSRYIETVPRVGYRFIAPLEEVSGNMPVVMEAPPATQEAANKNWRFAVLLGISAALLTGMLGYFAWSKAHERVQRGNGKSMLAVLPFENLTGDDSQEYFNDGLTEEMITQLGKLDPARLGIIARTSVMRYKHKSEPLEKVGQELGVQYVLEGSVRRDSSKLRISAELIQVKDQSRLWSQQYDREMSNILSLQAEIANDIAHKIEFTLAKSSAAHGKAPLTRQGEEAYDLYLKGRYFWNKRTPEGFQRAIEYFQEAIGKDPSFARAYAGLADSYALMSGYTASPPGDLIPKAQAAAHRAVELDDSLAEAHTSMAVVAQNFDWDWVTAEREYRRAIALDDNYAQAHHWYGEYLGFMGRYDEAFAELERARQLDPLSLIIACDKGVILYYARQYDAALKQLLAVQDLDPYFPRLAVIDGVYIQKGMYAEALTDLKKRPSDGAWDWGTRATIYGRLGRDAEARLSLREWQRLERRRHVDPLSIMSAYIAMGKKDLAIATLQKAYSEHSIGLAALKVDPTFDPLRDEEKFQELLRRTHLAP